MGKPAARISDMHMCPMVTPGLPPIPHVGGPITGPGCPTVMIGGMPAAVMGDMCTCVGPPDSIVLGSTGVFIGGKPAARIGDSTAHGGTIALGCPTVLIGETSSANGEGGSAQMEAMEPGLKQSAAFATKQARIAALQQAAQAGDVYAHKHNEEDCKVQFQAFSEDGEPAKNVRYEITTFDGKTVKGRTDNNGMTSKLSGYTEGMCNISFPD